jgi:hypothetical protein
MSLSWRRPIPPISAIRRESYAAAAASAVKRYIGGDGSGGGTTESTMSSGAGFGFGIGGSGGGSGWLASAGMDRTVKVCITFFDFFSTFFC